jgi:hypothetical protein
MPMPMPRRALRSWTASACAALGLLAVEHPAAAWSASCESPQRYTLPNGIEVVLVPEGHVPTVAIVSSVHAGSRDDPKGHEGLAHYVEHLTFLGTATYTSAMDLYEEIGATGLNATTTLDTTDYYALVPSSQLERALWIEARRLGTGLSAQTKEQALSEQRVLQREQAYRFGWTPAYELMKATFAELYPGEHPYHAALASEASIEGLTLNDARWFFAQHYRTDATRLVLVGDFAPDVAKGSIEKYFGALARSSTAPAGAAPGAPAAASAAPEGDACRWAQVARPVAKQRIVQHTLRKRERYELLWPVAPGEDTEQLGWAFASIGGQLTEVMQQTGLSHQVSTNLVTLELGSYWSLGVEVAPGQSFDKIEPLVAKVLQASANPDDDAIPKRQAWELSDQLAQERLLQRARDLARRECAASACVEAARLAAAADPKAAAARFALDSALVVERRYSVGASEDGDLEVVK